MWFVVMAKTPVTARFHKVCCSESRRVLDVGVPLEKGVHHMGWDKEDYN